MKEKWLIVKVTSGYILSLPDVVRSNRKLHEERLVNIPP